jgi:CheY-like chemotaxis protein/Flp pilus assembly protein TadD
MSDLPSKILIIDDDASVAQGVEEPLSRNGVRVVKAHDLNTALYMFNQQKFEVVMIEHDFEEMHGLALIQKWRKHEIKEKRYTGFILMITGKYTAQDEALLRELGELETIMKPFTAIQLLSYLNRSQARKNQATSFATMLKRIEILRDGGAPPEAIIGKIKEQIGTIGPNGINLMCEVLEQGGQHQPALELVDMMLIKMPQNTTLLGRKGRILLRLGRTQEARDLLVLTDKIAPKNIERLEDLAEACLKSKLPDQGENAYRQLIDLNADEPEKRFEFFDQLTNYGYDDHAMKLCTDTTAPQEVVRFYNNKGVAHSRAGEIDTAIAEYQRAIKYYPNHRDMHKIEFNLAVAFYNLKTHEAMRNALDHAKRCVELNPEFEKGVVLLQKIQKALGIEKLVG